MTASAAVESPWRYLNPSAFARRWWGLRELLGHFTARQVMERYRGSYLGIVWAVLTPLLMLAIYTFVFGVLFKAPGPESPTANRFVNFALMLFAGLVAFNLVSECLTQAPYLVVRNPNYVKKVVFPLEILPASMVGGAMIHSLIGLAILIAARGILAGGVPWQIAYLPLYYLPLIFLTVGLCWVLASLGVFLRDIGHVMVVVVQMLMFLTPVFYDEKIIPPVLRFYYQLNPLTIIVNGFRRCVLSGQGPDWPLWAGAMTASLVVMLLGYAWFMKIKRGFADVI